jgi:hypothetical protein
VVSQLLDDVPLVHAPFCSNIAPPLNKFEQYQWLIGSPHVRQLVLDPPRYSGSSATCIQHVQGLEDPDQIRNAMHFVDIQHPAIRILLHPKGSTIGNATEKVAHIRLSKFPDICDIEHCPDSGRAQAYTHSFRRQIQDRRRLISRRRICWANYEVSVPRFCLVRVYELTFNDLPFRAHSVHRENFESNQIQLSKLLSIKTGGCPEDCGYCSQSARYATGLNPSKLMAVEQVVAEARKAKDGGATRHCMGAAWRSPKKSDMDAAVEMMRGVKGLGDGITAELSCYFFGGDLNLLETLNKRFGCTRAC